MLAFDPSDLPSGAACVDFLKGNGITVSQKTGAMLIWLAKRGIQASLAAIEDCSAGSEKEKFILSLKKLVSEEGGPNYGNLSEAAANAGFGSCMEGGIFKIISEYEEPEASFSEASPSYLPATRQEASMLVRQQSITASSILNDRKYIEELAFDFLDSDDEEVICANMKKLARISLMSGQSPEKIYISAFRRNSRNIWLKTAGMIAEMNDREFGETISVLISDSESREKTAATAALQCLSSPDGFRAGILLSLIPKIMSENGQISILTSNRRIMTRLLSSYPQHIKEIISSLTHLSRKAEPADMKTLRAFISDLNGICPVWELIDREASLSAADDDRIYFIWMLSAIKDLPQDIRSKYSSEAARMMAGDLKSVYTAEMIKTVLKNFRPYSMQDIEDLSMHYESMSEEMKECAFSLWEETYGSNPPETIKDLIKEIFCSGSPIAMKRALSSKMLQGCLPFKSSRPEETVIAAAEIYAADRSGDIKKKLPKELAQIVTDPCGIFLNSASKAGNADDIDFASSLFISANKSENDDSWRIIRFLNGIKGEYCEHAMKAKAKILRHAGIRGEEGERLLASASEDKMALSSKIEIIFPILELIDESEAEKAVRELSEETEKASESEKSIFIETAADMFRTAHKIIGAEVILAMFMKKNAVRMTMPSLDMKMRMSDEYLKNNRYMSRYEEEKWSWENCGQSLFAASALISRQECPAGAFNKAADLIAYAVRHWSLLEKSFLISDRLIFRIMLDSLIACANKKCPESERLAETIKLAISGFMRSDRYNEACEEGDLINILDMLGNTEMS